MARTGIEGGLSRLIDSRLSDGVNFKVWCSNVLTNKYGESCSEMLLYEEVDGVES